MSHLHKMALMQTLLAAGQMDGCVDVLLPQPTKTARDRDQRTKEDISARQRKRRDKLARRAKRHAAEDKAGDGAQGGAE